MKIFVVSDLHTEFGEYPYDIPNDADVIVLAGDTGTGTNGVKFAKTFKKPVVMVAGNHEFYGHKFPELYNSLAEESVGSNVFFLQNDEIVIDGVRFLGATFWTDFNLYNTQVNSMLYAQARMNDFLKIRTGLRFGYQKLTPQMMVNSFNESKKWLKNKLQETFTGKTVLVSHHLLTEYSINPQYSNDPLNPAYASNLTNLIGNSDISLYIHGHTHSSSNFILNGTRVVCNPFGYLNYDVNPNFNSELIIEV